MAKLQPDYIKWVLTLNASQAQEEFHKLEKANKSLEKETTAYRKQLAELTAQGKKGSDEWNNLRKAIAANSREMSQNRAKMAEVSKQFNLNSMTVKQLGDRLKALKTEFKNTSQATNPQRYNELRKEITKTQAAMDKADASARGLRGGFFSLTKMKQSLIGFFNGVGMTIFALVAGSFKSAFNIIVDFEKANAKLAAVLGTSTAEIKELEAGARKLGATTSYTAAEVTGLQIELAKLGFSKQQILDMEGAVLKFAKAVGTDLSSASAFAGAALRIFGKDASDANEVLATFAVSTTKSALDFNYLQSALSTVGPVANAAGLTFEDVAAMLGMLANKGFDASTASTALRNIILNLCTPSSALAAALGEPVKNASDLAKGLQKLTSEGIDLEKALELTDKRSVAVFEALRDSADELEPLRNAITDVTGEFNEMSDTMGNTVAGAMAGLQSAAQELVLKISEGTNGPIKDLIKMLTSLVQWVGKLIVFLGKFSGLIKMVTVAFVTYKATLLVVNRTIKIYNSLVALSSKMMKAAKAAALMMSAGFKTMTTGIKGATTSWKAFGAAMKATPWGAVISGIVAVVSAIASIGSSTSETMEKIKEKEEEMAEQAAEHARKREEFQTSLEAEKKKITDLYAIANDMNIEEERRLKAIKAINKVCPEFNGYLEKEGKALKGNKEILDKYVLSLEQKMRLMYYKDEYEQYIREQLNAKRRWKNALEEYNIHKDETVTLEDDIAQKYGDGERGIFTKTGAAVLSATGLRKEWKRSENPYDDYTAEKNAAFKAYADANKALADLQAEMKDAGIDLEAIFNSSADTVGDTKTGLGDVADATRDIVDQIKTLKKELKDLRKVEASTDGEYTRLENRKKDIRERIKELEKQLNIKGKNKDKRTPGTYGEDSIDEATAEADDTHQKKLLEINKMKPDMSAAEYTIKKNEELIRYSGDLIKALEKLRSETDATHTQTLDKITAEENKIAQIIIKAQQEINKATVQQNKDAHAERLNAIKAAYEEEQRVVEKNVQNEKQTQGAAEIYLLAREKQYHEDRLKELQDYQAQVTASNLIGNEEKKKMLADIAAQISGVQSQILTATGKFTERMREMMTDTTSVAGIKTLYEKQRLEIESTYDEMIKQAKKKGEDTTALELQKQRRISALNHQYKEEQYKIQEIIGLSWQDEYNRELEQLKYYHEQGILSTKEYEKKKLELGIKNAKKYFDYYANLSGSMFTAIQDAEIATSDAKYDVLIQQAKNNGEDTAALEEEKENKKLEIQKKYADVDFAIKCSQIIADTAVAVMAAWKIGPIAGPIAAALVAATGVAQLASAKAERDKIKNMQPGNTAGASSKQATAERVLSGYSDGGYTGDGDRYEVAGVVHRGEYVVPKPIMDNPRVVDAVGTIEAIRRNKILGMGIPVATQPAGYADGGYTSVVAPSADASELAAAVKDLRAALGNIRAHVVYKDIERAGETLDRARAPFTRKR